MTQPTFTLLAPSHIFFFSGPWIQFGALVILDRPRFVELKLLSARSPPGDCTARPALFQAFCAACVLLRDIRKDTLQILNHPSSHLHDRNLPYVQKIPAWPPISGMNSELEFQISAVAFQDQPWLNENRFLYTAETKDRTVVVKFTRQYCPKLHSFCAEQGHAPKLLGYGTVPGRWKVVVMELIKAGDIARHASEYWAKWSDDITKLVEGFHDQGWVHGDLRLANFIISGEQPDEMMLLDFDWGGECGKVFYPTSVLNDELVDKTVEDLRITKEHDTRVLTSALELLRPKYRGK